MSSPASAGQASEINDVVHQRHRLAILTIAAESDMVEFTYLKDALDLTAGNLSRHLSVLADARLVTIKKTFQSSRPKTWVRITKTGRKELAREMDSLRSLVRRHDQLATPDDASKP